MARYYVDTSAFTNFYYPEVGSARVAAIVDDTASVLQISNLAILETRSALAMKVRTGILDRAHAEAAMDKAFKDSSLQSNSTSPMLTMRVLSSGSTVMPDG